MKLKIMSRYLITVIITTIIAVLITNGFFYMFIVSKYSSDQSSDIKYKGVDNFVRSFKENIEFNMNKPYVSQKGLAELKKYNGWIQILDENGNEVYSKFAPQNALKHYSPVEIVQAHRYTGGIKGYTTFVSMTENKGSKWSYILGFSQNLIMKYTLYFNSNELLGISAFITNFVKVILVIVLIATIITILIGYIFVRILTKPLFLVMDGIKELSKGNYTGNYEPKGIFKDIHLCMNNLSDTLVQNKIQREKLENMREEWIENISHDLRTPLSSIKGYSELLCDDEYDLSDDEKTKYIGIITEKSNYMQQLLQDLRITYQLKNDSSILQKQSVNIVDLTAETIIDILNHPDYENREINFNPQENYILSDIDISLFKRALNNIIYNSLKHNSTETIINISIYKKDKTYIEIEDNGKGISDEDLENLFERYYRGTDTNNQHNGSGLGMAIAKEIILSHGGSINVESSLGNGTKVILCI